MKKYVYTLFTVVLPLFLPLAASAQSNLQNTTSNLQPQSSQTQTTQTIQDNTQNVQNNTGVDVFGKNAPSTLSVVSDPKQTTPDVTVRASQTTTADSEKTNSNQSRLFWFLIVLASAACVFLAYKILNNVRRPVVVEAPTLVRAEMPLRSPSRDQSVKPKKKASKRKKKKAHHH